MMKLTRTNDDINLDDINKINKNILSATHSIGCTFLGLVAYYCNNNILLNILCCFSISYFIWDSYFIVINKDKANYPFLFHHIVTSIVLEIIFNRYNHKILLLLVIIGELSNFPNYLIYHLIKTKDKSKKLFYWRHIQILWFGFFRVIVFGYFALNIMNFLDNYIIPILLLYPMYFIGIFWVFGQAKGVYNDFYRIKQE